MVLPKTPNKPAFLQLFQWIIDPIGYMEEAVKECGDIFTAKVSPTLGDLIFVSNPQALQQLLTNDRKQFSAPSSANRVLSPLAGDYSVLMLDGDYHRKRRQLLMPSFHGDRLHSYGDLITNLTEKIMDSLPRGQVFTARPLMQSISLQVIMETIFGLSQGERYEQLKKPLASLLEIFSTPATAAFLLIPALQKDLGAWSPWGKFTRLRQQIDDVLYAEIAERRANPDGSCQDILSMLMTSQDEEGHPLTDKELRDELLLLLFAGHETTATSMTWALYWTHYQRDVQAKILEELVTLGDHPNPMDIVRLPYLSAVCHETLRIYPVAMLTFPRVVEEPVQLQGYDLEPGTMVAGCMYLTLQREDLYQDPQKFKPERFLERQYSPFEFIPFGGGARRCIGEALALFEMKLVLATILSRYELALTEEKAEKPRRRGVTLAPGRGVKMVMLGKRG